MATGEKDTIGNATHVWSEYGACMWGVSRFGELGVFFAFSLSWLLFRKPPPPGLVDGEREGQGGGAGRRGNPPIPDPGEHLRDASGLCEGMVSEWSRPGHTAEPERRGCPAGTDGWGQATMRGVCGGVEWSGMGVDQFR